ncbi:uncharacterized protein M421DRAFT_427194 [Didymella exigua CBS 183.55]|uniref:LRAT domain-containing protein n=1 Tax=Didymella exigua CBS 183.55 TaxID=1150837 RepID=A0A6A5R8M8_9PLEO|nr:uncharacterized protein M421DRAFT_427194 [Didymella exigua CBS 183.55]KAF1922187.1 hypothetical protein M421DRAFT_427194 [Didymella exigua CBS 183.55]
MGSSSSRTADGVVRYSHQQHQNMIRENGYPVYILYIDLRTSVGGGFQPQMTRVLRKLATEWGTAGTAMQHWAIMVDGFVYELARKPDKDKTIDAGMERNSNFRMPTAIPYRDWETERQVKKVTWRKYYYTRKTKPQITRIAQDVAREMQRYNALEYNCQHFVTKLYDRLGCGYDTTAGWAPTSSEILPRQMPIVAEMAGNVTDNILSIALSSVITLLTLVQI